MSGLLAGGSFNTVQTLTDASSISTNLSAGTTCFVTIAGNRTLANPTGMINGQYYTWVVIQDATGGRSLAFGSKFATPHPEINQGASAVTVLRFVYNSTNDKFYCMSSIAGRINLPADWSTTSSTLAVVTGMVVTPQANTSYMLHYRGITYSATAGNGLKFGVDPGTNNIAGIVEIGRADGSSTWTGFAVGATAGVPTGGVTVGSQATSGLGTPFEAWVIVATGSSPGNISLYAAAESNGVSVSILECELTYYKLQ